MYGIQNFADLGQQFSHLWEGSTKHNYRISSDTNSSKKHDVRYPICIYTPAVRHQVNIPLDNNKIIDGSQSPWFPDIFALLWVYAHGEPQFEFHTPVESTWCEIPDVYIRYKISFTYPKEKYLINKQKKKILSKKKFCFFPALRLYSISNLETGQGNLQCIFLSLHFSFY